MFDTRSMLSPKSVGLLLVVTLVVITMWIGGARADGIRDDASAKPAAQPTPQPAVETAPVRTPEAVAPAPRAPRKARGGTDDVLEVEQELADLGYWTGPVDGVMDPSSRSAVMAFQKVEGLKRTGKLAPADREALRAAARPTPLETGYAHVEVDISRQVLFFVEADGTVHNVLPVSTGNGQAFTVEGVRDRAYTPRGRCTVYRKIAGTRVAPLGEIYYPNYLVGGIAIHGSPSIPGYPASHGCIRIPMWAAKQVAEMTPVGTQVIVHEGGSLANESAWLKQCARHAPENFNDSMTAQR